MAPDVSVAERGILIVKQQEYYRAGRNCALSVAPVEPDALSFPGARQAFDTRIIMTYKKDSKTARHTRIFRD